MLAEEQGLGQAALVDELRAHATHAALPAAKRTAMPASDFAVPGKRALPMHDAEHVKLAWDMVDRTQGLTSTERRAARRRILARAARLGVDTSAWSKPNE